MPDESAGAQPEVQRPPRVGRRPIALATKVRRLLLVNLVVFTLAGLLAEAGVRWLWVPRFWVHCDGWLFGSGQDRAGKKWWPSTSYVNEGREFHVRFRTNALGYRVGPNPPRKANPYRVAFVGDSFTEAAQVDYEACFVARLEQGLAAALPGREVVCENYGVAGTGPFDYWHRIIHDVFRPGTAPPDAVVLCLFPGNDFYDPCPADGFDPDGRPRREYFREPGWATHALTWMNLKSKLAYLAVRSARNAAARAAPMQYEGPWLWWADPALAASAPDAPAIRRTRALLRAIAGECDQRGSRLVIFVVGPAVSYAEKDGRSPLGQILTDWGIDAPVIDVAARPGVTRNGSRLVFRLDGHLTERGHAFLTAEALPSLRKALGLPAAGSAASTATLAGARDGVTDRHAHRPGRDNRVD